MRVEISINVAADIVALAKAKLSKQIAAELPEIPAEDVIERRLRRILKDWACQGIRVAASVDAADEALDSDARSPHEITVKKGPQ